jgi:pimeloyl-ACP methyl ester carboxylesterase
VLLCNPFGEEAIRSHRSYAILSGKLAKVGLHVMRFDYYGTGDSGGAVEEGSQAQWIEDILEANNELLASSGVSRVTWVGLRYGATLAMLASQRSPRSIAGLVAWNPVVNGAAYLAELEEAHADFLRQNLTGWKASAPRGSESLGFPLGPDLRSALAATDLASAGRPNSRQVTVVAASQKLDLQSFRRFVDSWGGASRWLDVTSSSPWNLSAEMNAFLVPTDLLDIIVSQVQESP